MIFPFMIYSVPHPVNDLKVMQVHLFMATHVIEMKGKSRQQTIRWDDLLEVTQMNNLKSWSYFCSCVSFQLTIVPQYQ